MTQEAQPKLRNHHKFMIDVSTNEKDVVDFLHSVGVVETGHILSPRKEEWIKIYHCIRLVEVFTSKGYKFKYQYVKETQTYEGEVLQKISLIQLKNFLLDKQK